MPAIPRTSPRRRRRDTDPVAYPVMRGGGPADGAWHTPEQVSLAARRPGALPESMRQWARWEMPAGLMDVRVVRRPNVPREWAPFGARRATMDREMLDEFYATNTLDGAMMEMHQSLASDGPLAHMCNFYTELVMGSGFWPELVPRPAPGDDPEEERELDREAADAQGFLRAVDAHQGSARSGLWPSMFGAVSQLVKLTTVYHRACFVKHGPLGTRAEPLHWGGEEVRDVPVCLEVVHPRDLGMVGLNAQKVPVSIYRNWPIMSRIPMEDMVYMSADLEGCHLHNSAGYGLPPVSGCIDAARLLAKIDQEDLPTLLRTSWTNIPLVFANMPGGDGRRKREQLRQLAASLSGGGPTLVGLPPDQVKVEDLKMNASMVDMDTVRSSLLNYMAAHMNLPQVSVGERDTTRAASSAKSNLMVQGSIQPKRERVGEALSRQWYGPILRSRYPKVAREWQVRVVFGNLDVESLAQKVEAINGIMASFALKARAYGQLLNIRGFDRMVDQERQAEQLAAQMAGPEDSSGAPATGGRNPRRPSTNKRNVSKPDEVNDR